MSSHEEFWKTQQSELEEQLAQFEGRISAPIVPGELESWLEDAGLAWQKLWPQLQVQTQYIHAKEFSQIGEEDPGLFGRIREMREADNLLMSQCDQVADQLKWIEKRFQEGITEPTRPHEPSNQPGTNDVEPTDRDFKDEGAMETDLKDDLDRFVSSSLELIGKIRKQEITLRTWLVEAYTRDRGVMD